MPDTIARLAVLDAIESVTGGSWLPEELLRHACQASSLPLTWGVPEMQSVLDRMVADKQLSTDRGRYFVFGGALVPLADIQAGQVG